MKTSQFFNQCRRCKATSHTNGIDKWNRMLSTCPLEKKPVSQNYSLAIFFSYLRDRVYLFELVMILLAKV